MDNNISDCDLATALDNNLSKRECKYYEPVSIGVFGAHYICTNEKSEQYLMQIPICNNCKFRKGVSDL